MCVSVVGKVLCKTRWAIFICVRIGTKWSDGRWFRESSAGFCLTAPSGQQEAHGQVPNWDSAADAFKWKTPTPSTYILSPLPLPIRPSYQLFLHAN